jgi:AraC-like DNA-binding protein
VAIARHKVTAMPPAMPIEPRRAPSCELPGEDDAAIMHPTYARLLCMLLRSLQVDVEAALAPAGLSWADLATREQWLSHASVERLALAALQATGRPALGIELGLAVPLSAHGPLGYAVVASRDLRQALQVVARYGALRHRALGYELQGTECGGVVLRVVERLHPGEARRFVLDSLFGTCLRLMETVAGPNLQGLRVELPLTEPPWRSAYQAEVEGELIFGAAQLAFHLGPDLLALPCLTADAPAFDAACRVLEAAQQAQTPRAAAVGDMVPRVLAMLGPQAMGYPPLTAVAARLHLSPRTLMRRLKLEGRCYQGLLDEVRQAQALALLRHGDKSFEAIAAELGFADTSNFSRTLRRWFGVTASALRTGAPALARRP